MAPTKHDIQVATDALRADATVWLTGSADLDQIRTVAAGLAFDRLRAGVFQLIVDAHSQLVAAVADRCGEATHEMGRIAATLHQVADTYDEEERRNLHALRHLY